MRSRAGTLLGVLCAVQVNETPPILEHTGARALKVEAGEVVSVLGAPGSGKSRLALELAFLAVPREGDVLLRGKNPLGRRARFGMAERPREVTLLVQNAEDQLFARTVFDDVAFGPRHLTISGDEVTERVFRALRAVRLQPEAIRDRSPFELSGGERRRVALAGVLAMEPSVLVLDEPTASLDPQTRNEFLTLLEPLRDRSAIIWLTARAREAALADRVYLLQNGKTQVLPSGEALLRGWRALAQAGIELPSIYELAHAVEERGISLPATASEAELQAALVAEWRQRHDR